MPPKRKTRAAAKAKAKKVVGSEVKQEEEASAELESQDTSVGEQESQDTSAGDAEQEAEDSVVVEDAGAEEETAEEEAAVGEEGDEILEEGDEVEEGDEPGDEILDEDEMLAEEGAGGEEEQEVIDLGDDEEAMEQADEEATEESTAQAGEEGDAEESTEVGEGNTSKENLFTIDKTPMDIQQVESKIDKEKKTDKKGKGKFEDKKDKGKLEDKKGKLEELKLRGRVLRVNPVRLQDLTSPQVTAILRSSIGFKIQSEGGSDKNNARSLEIWFHSPDEAEEMFVKFCNFNWKVNGRLSRVLRINSPQAVDITLKAWDERVSPYGLYDGRCVFVSNLPDDATQEQLMTEFNLARKSQIPTDKDGKKQGYALLEFSSVNQAFKQSKRKVTLGENELVMHTIGMKRIARTKDAQKKLDDDLKKLCLQGRSTDFSDSMNNSRNKGRNQTGENKPGQGNQGNQRPGQGNQGNQRPGQGNQRPGQGNQGNQRPGQGNQRPGQGNQRPGPDRGNMRGGMGPVLRQGAMNQNQKRRTSGGRDDVSPTKRGRMDRSRERNPRISPGGGLGAIGLMGNREMQLRQEMLIAQQSMLAQQMAQQSGMNINRGGMSGGGGRPDDLLRGELLGQMQNLQQGGLSDPNYLISLAQRLQQAQQGRGGGFGNY